MRKLIIIWDGQHGACYPDGRVRSETPNLIAKLKADGVLYVGQSLIINELRLAIRRGELDAADIELVVGGAPIEVFKSGNLQRWPKADGFSFGNEQLIELIQRK